MPTRSVVVTARPQPIATIGAKRVVDEVVGHEQRRVAEVLGLARALARTPSPAFRHRASRTPNRNFRSCAIAPDARDVYRPVEPKPYASRVGVVELVDLEPLHRLRRAWITSCAMRSPRCTVYGVARDRCSRAAP